MQHPLHLGVVSVRVCQGCASFALWPNEGRFVTLHMYTHMDIYNSWASNGSLFILQINIIFSNRSPRGQCPNWVTGGAMWISSVAIGNNSFSFLWFSALLMKQSTMIISICNGFYWLCTLPECPFQWLFILGTGHKSTINTNCGKEVKTCALMVRLS